jgi:hypothetical protein
MGERRDACRVLVGRSEGRRPLGIPRHRWEDNIKLGFQEIGWVVVHWINLTHDKDGSRALVTAVVESSGSTKCGKFIEQLRNC